MQEGLGGRGCQGERQGEGVVGFTVKVRSFEVGWFLAGVQRWFTDMIHGEGKRYDHELHY